MKKYLKKILKILQIGGIDTSICKTDIKTSDVFVFNLNNYHYNLIDNDNIIVDEFYENSISYLTELGKSLKVINIPRLPFVHTDNNIRYNINFVSDFSYNCIADTIIINQEITDKVLYKYSLWNYQTQTNVLYEKSSYEGSIIGNLSNLSTIIFKNMTWEEITTNENYIYREFARYCRYEIKIKCKGSETIHTIRELCNFI